MISIASDHAGFEMKESIIEWLSENGLPIIDFGTDSNQSVDYPDYAHAVAGSVLDEESKIGILICGSGNGICMTVNKWRDIRAALCWNQEIAKLARSHNDANIICLPGRFLTIPDAIGILEVFLNTEFEGGRHEGRVNKINPNFL
ncbi:ribose 5-phosphate isomerase B [bacterium]|nr:ribose 5-phosphate isomerase B [Candidatus Elulimicrobium humile]